MWRVSRANLDYGLCPSYGRLLLVPATITDLQVANCAKHRQGRPPMLTFVIETKKQCCGAKIIYFGSSSGSTFSLILAPAPVPALYCYLKMKKKI